MPVTSRIVNFDCLIGKDASKQDIDAAWIAEINGNNPMKLGIPSYQRPFDWKIHHFDSLIEDIMEAMNEGKSSYYLGPVGMHDLGSGELDIVDGQQRFTAITLLAIALRDICIDKGFFRIAINIHEKIVFLGADPRLESGEDPDVDQLDQNRTQLAFLQHWPSGNVSYRYEPPRESNMTLTFADSSPLDSGDDRKVDFLIEDWMKFPIGSSNFHSLWKFGKSDLEIQGKVDFDTMANGEKHNIVDDDNRSIQFKAYVVNNGPDAINPGDLSDSMTIGYDSDHDYFAREGFSDNPDKRARMFGTYRHLRQRLLQLIEDKCNNRDDELDWARRFFTLICKFETTVTLFDDLYEALNYFEKINDGSFSEPLNVRDLFNYRIKMLDHHYSQFVNRGLDKSNTSPDTIEEYLEEINAHWSGIRDTLQPVQVKKNKGGAHLIADFFQMYLLAKGNRKTSAKVQKELEEVDLIVSPKNYTSISGAKPSVVLDRLKYKRDKMSMLEHYAGCYASVMIHNTQSHRYLRMKHIQQNFTQGRSLLLSALSEIRWVAAGGIDFDDDSDYFTKDPDCYNLEMKIIEMVEYHVARSIILRHETDNGLGGGDWHGAVEDWNRALYWVWPQAKTAADVEAVLGKIWTGGNVTVSYDNGKTTSALTLKGIKTENDSLNPTFITGGSIDTSIQNNRYNIKQGTFLVWILEQKFRDYYPASKSGLDNLDINEDQTLEHILPQSCWRSKTLPIKGWEWWNDAANVTDKDDVHDYVDRLGNMCIVKKKYNSSYGNNSFKNKQRKKIGDYKSFTALSSSWLTMSDLSKKSKSASINALDCFDAAAFGPPSHHAILPFTKWEKTEVDARNKWMFECLQNIFS
jgi:hypothetical protein